MTATKRDMRAFNARKRLDLSALVGNVHGSRRVTAVEMIAHAEGPRQAVVLTCTCGFVTRLAPSIYKQRVGRCKSCSGRGERVPRARSARPAAVAKPRAPKVQRDYEAWVGRDCGNGFVVEAYESSPRPVFTVRCPSGHRFSRLAWDIAAGAAKGARRCPTCTNRRSRTADVARKDWRIQVAPEVCGCTYFDGVLRRVCGWCQRDQQQRGAA